MTSKLGLTLTLSFCSPDPRYKHLLHLVWKVLDFQLRLLTFSLRALQLTHCPINNCLDWWWWDITYKSITNVTTIMSKKIFLTSPGDIFQRFYMLPGVRGLGQHPQSRHIQRNRLWRMRMKTKKENIAGDNNDCDNDGDGNFDKDCDYTNRWRLNGRALIVIHTSDSGRCRTRCWVGHLFWWGWWWWCNLFWLW